MAKIFILPKQVELSDLKIANNRSIVGVDNIFFILFPNGIVADGENDDENRILTANNLVNKIRDIANEEKDIYLLYHIGYRLNLDIELKELIPQLFPKMYSHTDSYYKQIIGLIKEISENNLLNGPDTIIGDFFFDAEIEAKLELLHACLAPENAKEILQTRGISLIGETIVRYEINGKQKEGKVIDLINNDEVNKSDIQILTSLRKALLGE